MLAAYLPVPLTDEPPRWSARRSRRPRGRMAAMGQVMNTVTPRAGLPWRAAGSLPRCEGPVWLNCFRPRGSGRAGRHRRRHPCRRYRHRRHPAAAAVTTAATIARPGAVIVARATTAVGVTAALLLLAAWASPRRRPWSSTGCPRDRTNWAMACPGSRGRCTARSCRFAPNISLKAEETEPLPPVAGIRALHRPGPVIEHHHVAVPAAG